MVALLFIAVAAGCNARRVNPRILYEGEPDNPGVRHAVQFYEPHSLSFEWPPRAAQWQELLRTDGSWVKDGPYARWALNGQQVEAGSYRNDLREGEWTFWHEHGDIDYDRSGIYKDDVRVQAGPTPPGDDHDRPDR